MTSLVSLTTSYLAAEIGKLIDDADYDAEETFENVPSLLSSNYYGRRFRTRCVLLSLPVSKTKLR
ncbi:unnamed protein product [Protopolystoma xenopodis]|uniref:Uncharacterized protein n=1 Tax=Protopolystoma xenopodis TaxID=117903 RepID=A0A3S5CTZ1_9PLAT|nr:unnamed protein product [Protopolystoma xenopodis]